MQDYLLYSMYRGDNGLVLNESQNGVPPGMMRVSGILAKLERGTLNKNGRDYDWSSYGRGINQLKSKISQGFGLFGELEHPPGNRMTIDNNLISHRIEEIDFNESTGVVTGSFILLDTPKGKIAQSIIKSGGAIRPSSRAMGSLNNRVATIKNMYTFDIVGSPGFENAAMWLNESEQTLSYLDDKAIKQGFDIPTNAESWLTELSESYAVLITESKENINEGHLLTDETQNLNTNNHTMNTNQFDKTLFESEEGKTFLREAFQSFLTEAITNESYKPLFESVLKEQMKSLYLPLMERWVMEEYSPMKESVLVEQFAPNLISFIEQKNILNESAESPVTFASYVQSLNEAAERKNEICDKARYAKEDAEEVEDELKESLTILNESENAKLKAAGETAESADKAAKAAKKAAEAVNEALKDGNIDKAEKLANLAEAAASAAKGAVAIVESIVVSLSEAKGDEDKEESDEDVEAKTKDAKEKAKKAEDDCEEELKESVPAAVADTIEKVESGVVTGGVAGESADKAPGVAAELEKTALDTIDDVKSGAVKDESAHSAPAVAAELKDEALDTIKDVKSGVVNEGEAATQPIEQPKQVSLLESVKIAIQNAKSKSPVKTEPEITPVNEGESATDERPLYLKLMPEKYQSEYASLNESQKAAIEKQASIRLIESVEDALRFWNTRNFTSLKNTQSNVVLNENQAAPAGTIASNLATIMSRLR